MNPITLLTQAMKVFMAKTMYSAKKVRDILVKKQKVKNAAQDISSKTCNTNCNFKTDQSVLNFYNGKCRYNRHTDETNNNKVWSVMYV